MNLREQIEKEITEKVVTKLESHKVELAVKQVSQFQKESDSMYKKMVSDAGKFKKEYNTKTGALAKPFNELRGELYNNSQDFLKATSDLGLDGKKSEPYKKMQKLLSDMDKRSAFFVKEYLVNL
mgnify:FL=1